MSNVFLNSVDKVLHLERLGDKLVAASVACLLDTVLKGVGTKCQNGCGGINFLDDAGGVETVHLDAYVCPSRSGRDALPR